MTIMVRLSIIALFLSYTLVPAHATVRLAEQPNPNFQSTNPFLSLARLELGHDFWAKILDHRNDSCVVLSSYYSDGKLNNPFSQAGSGRSLSQGDFERLCETLKTGFVHITREIVPEHFWEEQLAQFYTRVLTPEEAQLFVLSYQTLPDTPAEAKLQQLRTVYFREVLPDLIPQIRNMAQAFRIPIGSMAPSLLAGDHIIVNKLAYQDQAPGRSDVVVFKFPEDESKIFVKRIIGLPKDSVEIRDKIVYLNDQALREDDYIQHVDTRIIEKTLNPRDNIGPLTVPENSYFVLGDNREQSLDSRFWGYVKRDQIIGKASIVYWSWDETAKTARWKRAGQKIH